MLIVPFMYDYALGYIGDVSNGEGQLTYKSLCPSYAIGHQDIVWSPNFVFSSCLQKAFQLIFWCKTPAMSQQNVIVYLRNSMVFFCSPNDSKQIL